MIRQPRSLVALRQSQSFDTIRRQLVCLDAPPVAAVSGVESIMAGWWHRAGGYQVGKIFSTWVRRAG